FGQGLQDVFGGQTRRDGLRHGTAPGSTRPRPAYPRRLVIANTKCWVYRPGEGRTEPTAECNHPRGKMVSGPLPPPRPSGIVVSASRWPSDRRRPCRVSTDEG